MRCTLYLLWCFHRRLSRRPAQAGIIMSRRADAEWPGTMSNHCKFTWFFFSDAQGFSYLLHSEAVAQQRFCDSLTAPVLSGRGTKWDSFHLSKMHSHSVWTADFLESGYFLKLNAKMWDNFLRLSMWFLLSQFVNVLWFMLTLLPLEVNLQCLNKVREASFTGLRLSCITSVDSFQILSTLSCSRFYTSC